MDEGGSAHHQGECSLTVRWVLIRHDVRMSVDGVLEVSDEG